MDNKEQIEAASRIACGDFLKELGDLARRAEKKGCQPQGERLAKAAKAIAKGNFQEAMRVRDDIKSDLDIAEADRSIYWALALIFLGAPLLGVALSFLK